MKYDEIILSEQFHEWYHEGLTKEEVAVKTAPVVEQPKVTERIKPKRVNSISFTI